MPVKEIDLVFRTMFAELGQRTLDATFESDFPIGGRFVKVPVNDRTYWYFDHPRETKTKRAYVGPAADPEIDRRVQAFNEIKDDAKARRKLVTTLVRDAGLPAPDRFAGDVVETMANAGLFRLRGVLVGTVAFQCYQGLLGVRFPSAVLQTGDADFAQFHSISAAVEDSVPPMLEVLKALDGSFREVPHQIDGRRTTRFRNAARFDVEFLTPNRGSSDNQGRPASMPALGGASAEPLRFLDFLIYEPVRSVLLHRWGVNVVVPAPERYAIHKLIVASRRKDDPGGLLKRDKDIIQSAVLIEAMSQVRRGRDVAEAFVEAWTRGPAWRTALTQGLGDVPEGRRASVFGHLARGLREIGEEPSGFGILADETRTRPSEAPTTTLASRRRRPSAR